MNTIKIVAHRGGFLPEGPIPEVKDKYTIPENTLEAFKRAFDNGWGAETDVRLTKNGQLVLSHDDIDQTISIGIPTLDELCQLAGKYHKDGHAPLIAFQIKRGTIPNTGLTVGRAVAKKMQEFGFENSILFDALLEEAQILHREFPWLNLSVSVGEENYSPTIYTPNQILTPEFTSIYTSVWADEWTIQGSINNEGMFKKFRDAYSGRIDVISPELHYSENHPLSNNLEGLKNLWQEIISWGNTDGICTDYPSVLSSFL